jgi:hypothetical protein
MYSWVRDCWSSLGVATRTVRRRDGSNLPRGQWTDEQHVPADGATTGIVDSWSLKYSKFLVNYHEIVVADAAGKVAGKLDKPRFVNNADVGDKKLLEVQLDAKAYPQVSYQIKTAVESAELVDRADPADLAMMVRDGLSVYVEGEATRRDPADLTQSIVKTFHWGFKTQTKYEHCVEVNTFGEQIREGVVIYDNKTDFSQLTTHGDHLLYDSLQSGAEAEPKMRFAEKAAADDGPNGNGDGDISLQELCREKIDPDVYDAAGLSAPTVGDFVISLARRIGHFRGEGECTIVRIDPLPPGLDAESPPCAEYE